MKKIGIVLFVIVLLAGLCACGESPAEEKREDAFFEASGSNTERPAASASDMIPEPEEMPAEEEAVVDPAVLDESMWAIASGYTSNSLDELILAIGQPLDGEYVVEDGTTMGIYTYPGFYVKTERSSAGEMIDSIYLREE